MSNHGYYTIILKDKMAFHDLMTNIIAKNFKRMRGRYMLPVDFFIEKHNWHYGAMSEITEIKFMPDHIRIEGHFVNILTLGLYFKNKGIDFIYSFTDEYSGMGGYTNDTTGEFFKCSVNFCWNKGEDSAVEIPITATEDDIKAIITKEESKRDDVAIHIYTMEYCHDDYFELSPENRVDFEEQMAELSAYDGAYDEEVDTQETTAKEHIPCDDDLPF